MQLRQPAQTPQRRTQTFIPSSIVFEGMPDTRWWAFEDRRTNFGEVQPDATDLGKLLLLEFGLVYANDWFVLPYPLAVGSVAEVKGIALTNVFGERFWIEPPRAPGVADWEDWSMFTLTAEGTAPAGTKVAPRLALLPTAPKVQESAAVEEVALVRDEVTNMVWGIERRVLLASGATRPGNEAAREYRQWLQQLVGPVPKDLEPEAPVRYEVMNTVPEQWIPFISGHVDNDARETKLQRAALRKPAGQ